MKPLNLSRFAGVLCACLLLFTLVRINHEILPLGWPDEALFSAPAAELAERGVFATPVLRGLIPGMERATLWNSPLYMVLTAIPYSFTGESRAVARFCSFLQACVALAIFAAVAGRLSSNRIPAYLMPVLLTFDLTFQRAANTVRMDMLALCFFLGAFYCLMRDYAESVSAPAGGPALSVPGRRPFFWPLCAGLCTGAAALSHPIAVLLVPVALIWTLPRWRALLWGMLGTVLVLCLWLPYIWKHIELFCVQFIAQLIRKKDILSFFGGDTGGVFRVFTAQYGGHGYLMLLAGLMIVVVALAGLGRLIRARNESSFARLYASFLAVFGMVLLSSEAWYPLYVGPVLLWTAVALWSERWRDRIVLLTAAFVLICGTLVFTVREHLFYRTPEKVARFEAMALEAARDCRTIYLRVRPDPYFLYRKHRPDLEVLEFIPGKLQFDPGDLPFQCLRDCMEIPGGHRAYLLRRYEQIDCFLLDSHDDWEPFLRDYLKSHRSEFTRTALGELSPLDAAYLFRRQANSSR